ncbi:hypothetical protein N7520_003624 [Penicillium odoratum]|uniref:uncharacterized protein n=1 Tax=Penicillium odoratum TaxID=1167516 RepID=UPI002547C766|nr:uncharacterized protein N7520_003624 [Penicillium odoratum]KAJ5769065.1 hypothetical protein N7520_003624 [Penicillium odoratum]
MRAFLTCITILLWGFLDITEATSLTTITETSQSTVSQTITSTYAITTTETICTLGSAPHESCTNSVWAAGSLYYSANCASSATLGGASTIRAYVNVPWAICYEWCTELSCSGIWMSTIGPFSECYMLSGTPTIVPATSSQALLEVFTTNPCLETITSISTETSVEVTTVDYTVLYTSTVIVSTPTPTPNPTPTPTPGIASSSVALSYSTPIASPPSSAAVSMSVRFSSSMAHLSLSSPIASQSSSTAASAAIRSSSSVYQLFSSSPVPSSSSAAASVPIHSSSSVAHPSSSSRIASPSNSEVASAPIRSSSPVPHLSSVSPEASPSSPTGVPVYIHSSSSVAYQSSSPPTAFTSSYIAFSDSVRPSSSVFHLSSSSPISSVPLPKSSTSAPSISSSTYVVSSPGTPFLKSHSPPPASESPSFANSVSPPYDNIPSGIPSHIQTTHTIENNPTGIVPPITLTTETLYTTEVSTIYKCAPTVKDCPYAEKTPSVATQVVATGTTVYPVTTSTAGETPSGPPPAASFTTETLYTTELSKIYKCASTVKDCLYAEKTPSTITQVIATGTTVYPVTTYIAGEAPSDTASAESIYTETMYTTEFSTVHKCASTVKDCPYAEKTPSTITQVIPTETNFYSFTTSTGSTFRAHTITACPYDVDDCPSSEKTTYVTSKSEETYTVILVSAETPSPHATTIDVGTNNNPEVTPTVYVTSVVTILACPAVSALAQ